MNPSPSPLDSLVARAESLYSLPAVAMEVIELTAAPQVDAEALKRCIERDPALAGKVLRVVNSSLFGLSRTVDNLTQAIALLGTGPLKLLVLGFSLPGNLLQGIDAEALRTYWRGALTRAVVARQLIQSQWKRPGDEAFLIALLQDIGILVLLQQLATPYARFLAQVRAERKNLVELEQDALGFHHRTLTAVLLTKWNLPQLYVDSMEARPAATCTVGSKDLSAVMPQVLRLSNLLAELVDEHRLAVLPELLELGRRYCGMDKDRLDRLVAELEPQVDELADVLQLDTGAASDYDKVLAQAHGQLALVAEQAAGKWMSGEDTLCDSILQESRALEQALQSFTSTPTAANGDANTSRADAAQPSPPRRRGLGAAVASSVGTAILPSIAAAVRQCRSQRESLSLVYLQVLADEAAGAITEITLDDGLQEVVDGLREQYGLAPEHCRAIAPHTWAFVLSNFDRAAAMQFTQHAAREWASSASPRCIKAGVASIASVPKAFESERLAEAAQRCLDAARASGGSSIKSIEVY